MSSQFVWGYVIKHLDVNTQVETDISESVIGIPIFTDQGTGEVNNARLKLDSPNGEFLVKAPLMHRYDNIRITAFNSDVGGGTYNHVYEIIRMIPSESSTDGTTLELVLLGQEHNVQKLNYSKTHYYEGAAEVIQDLGDGYNANITGFQPILSGHKTTDVNNQIPGANFQTSIYAYGINEDQIYNRMNETVDKLGSSVDIGGALDFYEIRFDTDDISYDKITINVFPSGENGDVILEDTENVNMGETEGGIDAEVATLINAWGAVDQGTLPIQHSQYKSKQQRFPLQPQWVDTETYGLGSLIQDEGIHYESLLNNNLNLKPSLNLAFWKVITSLDFFGNSIQYSPWTVGKAILWKNAGSDRDSVGPFGEGCFDSNIIIFDNEENYSATWVDIRETNPANIDITLLYGGTEVYRGFRILVDGTAEGILSTNQFGTGNGNDRNSKPYTNSIVTYTGNEWRVLYEAVDDLECNVINEGRPYTFDDTLWIQTPEQLLTFNTFYAFHPHDGITNEKGVSEEPGTAENLNSAIRVRYDYTIPQLFLFPESFYKIGAWLNFRFPFPISTKGLGGEDVGVGELYGGANIVNSIPDAEREPATLDQQNMHLTHDGFRGFSNGESSEDYGQISSLDFWMKIDAQIFVNDEYRSSSEANFNMRCIIQDTSDNQVFQDFALNINNHWEPIHLPISSFETYRARRPLDNPLQSFIPIVELEALNIFQWRNIKNIIIQTQDSYDNQGRYSPDPFNNTNVGKFASLVLAGGEAAAVRRIELYIDAFRFTKPLLVNTGVPADRVIERDFLQRPVINDYFQLQSDAFAELEKSTFPKVEYNIVTQGRFDIAFGDSFWFRNPRLIPAEFESDDSPDGNNTNTIKLVAKRIEYSITNTEGGKGGFLRTLTGVRRFE